ncbi:hypothetical protein F4678DRAFT_467249 [Xylaria arbuscula]|nr:hypothetical protein F4678DRAFT_467249 [Xylaria arbuscula]
MERRYPPNIMKMEKVYAEISPTIATAFGKPKKTRFDVTKGLPVSKDLLESMADGNLDAKTALPDETQSQTLVTIARAAHAILPWSQLVTQPYGFRDIIFNVIYLSRYPTLHDLIVDVHQDSQKAVAITQAPCSFLAQAPCVSCQSMTKATSEGLMLGCYVYGGGPNCVNCIFLNKDGCNCSPAQGGEEAARDSSLNPHRSLQTCESVTSHSSTYDELEDGEI